MKTFGFKDVEVIEGSKDKPRKTFHVYSIGLARALAHGGIETFE
jgi:hypothetical protein